MNSTTPTTRIVELSPIDGRKSFYGKAKAITDGDITKLQSYNTIVAEYNNKTGKMVLNDWYSGTTARHINSFLNMFGYPSMRKSEIIEQKGKKFVMGGNVQEHMGASDVTKSAESELRKAKRSKISSWIDEASRKLDIAYENELTGKPEPNFKKGGKVRSKASWNRDRMFTSQQPHEQAYKKKRKSAIRDHKKDANRDSQEPHEIALRKAKSFFFKTGGRIRTNSKSVQDKVRQHILDSVYDYDENEFSSIEEANEHIASEFKRVADYSSNKSRIPNDQARFQDYLQGIPFNFEFEDWKIEEFLNGLGINPEGKEYSQDQMWKLYSYLIWKEVSKKYYNYETGGSIPEHMGASDLESFENGGEIEPAIYLADLGAYNEGKLIGEWIKLNDFDDASELMEHIQEIVEKWSKEQGVEREEYAVHDYEYLPSSIAGEYMGERDFERYYEIKEASSDSGLPLDVVLEWMSVTGSDDPSRIESAYIGQYDNATDMAEQYVDEGIMQPSSYDVYMTDTDRRLMAQEMSDNYASDIRHESDERVLEEANMDLEEYEEADEDRKEEMLDEAEETVRDRYYDEIYEALDDPYDYFVEEQGMYSPEDFFKASFVSIDYEKIGQELDWDHTFIDGEDGEHYTFTNNYKKGGKIRSKASWRRDRMFTSQQPHEQAYKKKRKSAIRDHKKDAGLKSQEAHEIASRKKARAKRLATGGALESFYPEREMNVDFAKGGVIDYSKGGSMASGGEIKVGQEVGLRFDSEYHKDILDSFVVEKIKNNNYSVRGKKNDNTYTVPRERIIVFRSTYAEGGEVWKVSDLSNATYLGLIEFQTNDEEFHNFEIMETPDRLIFGGSTNSGFIESGYIEKDGFSTDEVLQALLEDLEVYYNDGAEYVSEIVVNDRM